LSAAVQLVDDTADSTVHELPRSRVAPGGRSGGRRGERRRIWDGRLPPQLWL